jgi:hypothetical protein
MVDRPEGWEIRKNRADRLMHDDRKGGALDGGRGNATWLCQAETTTNDPQP